MSISPLVSSNVVSLTPTMTIRQAARWMKSQNVGCVAILDEEQPIGLVTDRDIALACGTGKLSPDAPITELAAHPPVTVLESLSLPDAIATMAEEGVRRLLVTDGLGRMVGILSVDDLVPLREFSLLAERFFTTRTISDVHATSQKTQAC